MDLQYRVSEQGRLSAILKGKMRISTGLMNRLKWQNKILVDGIPRHTDYIAQPGQLITLELDEPVPEYPPEEAELTVLYEDESFLAVDKKPGMLIHPSRNQNTGTLANAVAGYYRKNGQKSAFHPITRLDRDTFGVVLLAKNSHIHALMNESRKSQSFTKIYEALIYGNPPAETGQVNAPIARLPLPSLLRHVSPEGKPCITQYHVVESYGQTSLLQLIPITGRTHQLRIHCAYMGCPILGDPQYGSPESQDYSRKLGLTYQRLCAKKLDFVHPLTEERIQIKSFMSADIKKP